ncbi:hypothetical protein BV911_07780 [Pseudoruegeria sp. SK021]|nr:hypothetical protein BV911_07780 [Pseudoruegeria sp. SK021]
MILIPSVAQVPHNPAGVLIKYLKLRYFRNSLITKLVSTVSFPQGIVTPGRFRRQELLIFGDEFAGENLYNTLILPI